MVKADLTRDYYGDLQVAPTADIAEIKKQYRKLALVWHPDRNPGRESEVMPTFQKIQSAQEVLLDEQEKAKYDANRVRPSGRYQTGGNQRGNPWANVSSHFPQPPKPPTARTNTNKPPPPSAGAQRYKNFETPKQTPHQASQEGAEARKSTYEAWESMHKQPGTSSGWKAANRPQPPPRNSREDEGFQRQQPPKTRHPYEEPQQYPPSANSSPRPDRRAQSSSGTNRKGFMPNTPGGDESAAPKGTYFTARKSAEAPPPPPRPTPVSVKTDIPVDPLRQFREKSGGSPDVRFDTRQSTPYATHGGEKLNPFENGGAGERLDPNDATNMNRSKSTRETRNRSDQYHGSESIPRAGSDSNLNSPHRNYSFNQRQTPTKPTYSNPLGDETSSSDSGPELNTKHFYPKDGRRRAVPRKTSLHSQQPSTSAKAAGQQVPNGQTQPSPGQAKAQTPNGEPSMYGHSQSHNPSASSQQQSAWTRLRGSRSSSNGVKLPTVSEQISSDDYFVSTPLKKPSFNPLRQPSFIEETFPASDMNYNRNYEHIFGKWNGAAKASPSGAAGLFPTEQTTFSVVDNLVNQKNKEGNSFSKDGTSSPVPSSSTTTVLPPVSKEDGGDHWTTFRDPATGGSSSQKQNTSCRKQFGYAVDASRLDWDSFYQLRPTANPNSLRSRFSIPVDDNTFSTRPMPPSSAENINTTFTPEDWHGKFEGNGYFQHEQKAANMPHPTRNRTQSGSRSRGRSPIKVRPIDPNFTRPHESPNPAKFSPEEWAGTFKEQTFMPPPPPPSAKVPPRPTRKGTRGSVPKPTMGTAAVIDDSDSSLDKPLFTGRKSYGSSFPPSPDPMDVDTPPATKPSTPPTSTYRIIPQGLKPQPSPQKRPAATSGASSPIEAAELKVNFEDLSVRDLISSMNLPAPPTAPKVPESDNITGRPSKESYELYLVAMGKYMFDWDLFNSRIMLHLVSRKNQNDALGSRRWMEDGAMETYRLGLREDKAVFDHLVTSQTRHGLTMKDHAIVREKMKVRETERPRKKQS